LSTTVLPTASAGAAFQAGIAIGKFQGLIRPKIRRSDGKSGPRGTESRFCPCRREVSLEKCFQDSSRSNDFADTLHKDLALFPGEDVTEFIIPLEQGVPHPIQQIRPDFRRRGRASRECLLGGHVSAVYFLLAALGNEGQNVVGVGGIGALHRRGRCEALAANAMGKGIDRVWCPKKGRLTRRSTTRQWTDSKQGAQSRIAIISHFT
jgi:hypothetical protein